MNIDELEERATQGDAEAQYKLGKKYFLGNGIAKDEVKAFELFLASSKAGCKEGQAYLAYCVHEGIVADKNEKTAKPMLAALCSENFPVAYELLGLIYLKNNEYPKAIACFKKAGPAAEKSLGLAIHKQLQYRIKKYVPIAVIVLFSLIVILIIIINNGGNRKKYENNEQTKIEESEAMKDSVSSGSKKEGATYEDITENDTSAEEVLEISNKTKAYAVVLEDSFGMKEENIINCYANALANISKGRLPIGISQKEMNTDYLPDRYSVADVDGDQIEELILVSSGKDSLYRSEYILGFNEKEASVELEFSGIPFLQMYEGGMIKSEAPDNQSLDEDFWPYQLYKYDEKSNRFYLEQYIESWNGETNTKDSDEKNFPKDIDENQDGKVFVLYDENYEKSYSDTLEYELDKQIQITFMTL